MVGVLSCVVTCESGLVGWYVISKCRKKHRRVWKKMRISPFHLFFSLDTVCAGERRSKQADGCLTPNSTSRNLAGYRWLT